MKTLGDYSKICQRMTELLQEVADNNISCNNAVPELLFFFLEKDKMIELHNIENNGTFEYATITDKGRELLNRGGYTDFDPNWQPNLFDKLENDGLVKVAYASDKSIITIRLSPRGQQFLEKGGYSRIKRTQVKGNVTNALWCIAEAVLIAIASGYCGWLLRGCTLEDSTAPGRPEPSEHHSIKTSSMRLSSKSLFDLNVVNIFYAHLGQFGKGSAQIFHPYAGYGYVCDTLVEILRCNHLPLFGHCVSN